MNPETSQRQPETILTKDFNEFTGDELQGALLAEVNSGWDVNDYHKKDIPDREKQLLSWAKSHLENFNEKKWLRQSQETNEDVTPRRLKQILNWLKDHQPTEPEPWNPTNPINVHKNEYGNHTEERMAILYHLMLKKLRDSGFATDEDDSLQLFTALHSPADSLGVDFFLTLKTGSDELTLTCDITNNTKKDVTGANKIIFGYRFNDEKSLNDLADELVGSLKLIKKRRELDQGRPELVRRLPSQRPGRNPHRHYNARG